MCKKYFYKQWHKLLEIQSDELFLFPFCDYFEVLKLELYQALACIRHSITLVEFEKIIISEMKFLLLESVKRTIVWEFNQNRLKNSKLTFPKYLRKLRSKNQISFLFKKYPVLKEIINNAIKNYSLSFKLLCSKSMPNYRMKVFQKGVLIIGFTKR
ncbi:hypothetical protein EKM59_08570 [Legionella septentrionalis]|uniref:Uncharacterized protein n=1 Tax=Legionella septentrionalis TaxID=2498109 RepID=A0A433JIB4_9GAMM|nr:hypothetical protein EKM59_08570 [Legionella septentrionalis]